jgi:hypothetical protein
VSGKRLGESLSSKDAAWLAVDDAQMIAGIMKARKLGIRPLARR